MTTGNTLVRAYAHYIRHAHSHPPALAAERAVKATKNFLERDRDLTLEQKLAQWPALERLYNHYLRR